MDSNEKIQEIFIKLSEINGQLNRLVSDAESEKEVRKRLTEDQNRRIRVLEDYKNNQQGVMTVIKVIVGVLCTVVAGLLVLMFKNK